MENNKPYQSRTFTPRQHSPNYQGNRSQPYNRPTSNQNYQKDRSQIQIDYRIKPYYSNWPNNSNEIRDASMERLLGWWRFLENPKTPEQVFLIKEIVYECKNRYCRENQMYENFNH